MEAMFVVLMILTCVWMSWKCASNCDYYVYVLSSKPDTFSPAARHGIPNLSWLFSQAFFCFVVTEIL